VTNKSRKQKKPAVQAPKKRPVPARESADARIARLVREKRNAQRREARAEEKTRVASLVRAVVRERTKKERVNREKRPTWDRRPPRERDQKGHFLPRAEVPALPRRQKKRRPPRLRDQKGHFAPPDTLGEELGEWITVWQPGWQHRDGSSAVAFSSLREHPEAEKFLDMLRNAGDWRSPEYKAVCERIAQYTGVHVQEVYTLGFSP
jgi:hypothetical protein